MNSRPFIKNSLHLTNMYSDNGLPLGKACIFMINEKKLFQLQQITNSEFKTLNFFIIKSKCMN